MSSVVSIGRKLLARWRQHARHGLTHLYVATVIASVIHILNTANLPLELPATTLLASVATVYEPPPLPANDVRRHLAVVEIDEARHLDAYRGISPLDRCQLKTDIATLLGNPRLEALAIDLDLSPVQPQAYEKAMKAIRPTERSAPTPSPGVRQSCEQLADTAFRCQCELEALLADPGSALSQAQKDERHAHLSRTDAPQIIAIKPLGTPAERGAGLAWDDPQRFMKVAFGSPDLQVRFGMVHDYEFPPPGYAGDKPTPFAELVAQALCAQRVADAPSAPAFAQPAGCALVRQSERPPQRSADRRDETEFKRYPISYYETRFLHDGGRPLSFGDPCLAGPQPYNAEAKREPCDIRFLVLGGSYGVEDRYLTAVGIKPGVQVHAAIAAQLRSHTWHGWGFLADIALGTLLFGPLVDRNWQRYFRQRALLARARSPWRHPKLAYRWLLWLAVWLGIWLVVLILFSSWAYASHGVWISPVPMALAMLVESVVTGSVHVANHVIRDVQTTLLSTAPGTLAEAEPDKRVAVVAGKLPRALAACLIAIAVFELAHDLFA